MNIFDSIVTNLPTGYNYNFWFICFLSVFLVAIAKSGFGGALGALSAPILFTILPVKIVLGILLPLYLITDLWAIWIWRGYCVLKVLKILAFYSILGQILGFFLFSFVDSFEMSFSIIKIKGDDILKIFIGIIALLSSLKYWSDYFWSKSNKPNKLGKRNARKKLNFRASIWGTISGFSSFISLTGGIPIQILMLPMQIHRFFFVGTLCWYFLIINIAKVPLFVNLEIITLKTLLISLVLIPIIPIGVILGKWLNKKMTQKLFYHFANIVLFFLGIRLIIVSL